MPQRPACTVPTALTAHEPTRAEVEAYGAPSLPVGPAEVDGERGEDWSPEALLVAAAEASTMLTFFAQARRSGLRVSAYRSEAEGTVGPDAQGRWGLTALVVRPQVEVPDAATAEAVHALFRTLPGHSAVLNALCARVQLAPTVTVVPAHAGTPVPFEAPFTTTR